MSNLIEKQSAEIVELREKLDEAKLGLIWYSMLDNSLADLIDEIESLKNQVYNLTLYLHRAIITGNRLVGDSTFGDVLEEGYEGMSGYNPEILEVQHE